jgi:hypothetical protein
MSTKLLNEINQGKILKRVLSLLIGEYPSQIQEETLDLKQEIFASIVA